MPINVTNSPERFVVDTHALWWYLFSSERLSTAAAVVFLRAATGEATIIIPAIVVAELYYLSIKLRDPVAPSELMDMVRTVRGMEFSDLGMAQLEKLDDLHEIPEMHDRLIDAESMVLDAPVITRDRAFSASPHIQTVW